MNMSPRVYRAALLVVFSVSAGMSTARVRPYAGVMEPLFQERGPAPAAGSGETASIPMLSFVVREVPPFRVAEKKPNFTMLTRDGLNSRAVNEGPYFIVGSMYAKSPISNRRKFAVERLQGTGSVIGISIVEAKEIQIDNIAGYEFLAEASDTQFNKPVIIYQVILFAENRYFVMQGYTTLSDREAHVKAFRAMASSFKRR